MIEHKHYQGTCCVCRMDAEEPNEECNVHGFGTMITPRCDQCGRFFSYV